MGNANAVGRGSGNPQHDLNHMAPAANTVHLGDRMFDVITNLNALTARFNQLIVILTAANGTNVPVMTTVAALLPAPVAIKTLIAAAQGASAATA